MTPTEDGGPAFPNPKMGEAHFGDASAYPGMTLRDYFAAKAMQTLIAGEILRYTESACDEHCAHYAYKFADAMIAARKEGA